MGRSFLNRSFRIFLAAILTAPLLIHATYPAQAYAHITNCKLVSANGNTDVNLGWPRHNKWLPAVGDIKILVVGIEFSSARESGSIEQMVAGFELSRVADFYKKASYGKMNLSFSFVNKVISLPISDDDVSDRRIASEVVKIIPRDYKLSDFDGLIGITTTVSSYKASTALPGFTIGNETGSLSSSAILAGISSKVPRWSDWMTVAHEIGHLLGLMDLWTREDAQSWEGKSAAPFSLMSTGAGWTYAPDFYGWEKWLVGWIPDSDVLCIDSSTQTGNFTLTGLSRSDGQKIAVIPVSPTNVFVIEMRLKSELDFAIKKPGPLVYEVDLTKNQFELPIKIYPSSQALIEPFSRGIPDWQRFMNATLSNNEVIDIGPKRIGNIVGLMRQELIISDELPGALSKRIETLILAQQNTAQAVETEKNQEVKTEKAPLNTPILEQSKVPKKNILVCQKGRSIKKISAISPKCPAGYKKKK